MDALSVHGKRHEKERERQKGSGKNVRQNVATNIITALVIFGILKGLRMTDEGTKIAAKHEDFLLQLFFFAI